MEKEEDEYYGACKLICSCRLQAYVEDLECINNNIDEFRKELKKIYCYHNECQTANSIGLNNVYDKFLELQKKQDYLEKLLKIRKIKSNTRKVIFNDCDS